MRLRPLNGRVTNRRAHFLDRNLHCFRGKNEKPLRAVAKSFPVFTAIGHGDQFTLVLFSGAAICFTSKAALACSHFRRAPDVHTLLAALA